LIGLVDGEVETEDGVLVIKRVHVTYHLKTAHENHETANRAHDVHAGKCPVYKTLSGCIDITTELVFEPDA
jgi:uncharacterized OsmC-like protein